MEVSDALIKRKSTRAFLDKKVSRDTIERILSAASHAPSGTNAQPWQVAVVTGNRKKQLETQLIQAFKSGAPKTKDYQYYPDEWIEPYKSRRKACGLQLYSTLGIRREDKDKQFSQWQKNYSAFDAPVMLFFFLDPIMKAGSYIDYGMFLQSIMLAAIDNGLATCPQAALAEYPSIVKQSLAYPEESILLCGMALGYEDTKAKVNSYRTPREDVHVFTKFFE